MRSIYQVKFFWTKADDGRHGDVSPPPSVIASRIYKKRGKNVKQEVSDDNIFESSSPAHVMHPHNESNVQHDHVDYLER